MNYDRMIVELLDRIQCLEERVAALEQRDETIGSPVPPKEENKVTTADIRDHIRQQIRAAGERDQDSVVLRASDIHREMKLKSRFPMVCNAMRQCMKDGDEVVHETASGYSSSLEIRYYC